MGKGYASCGHSVTYTSYLLSTTPHPLLTAHRPLLTAHRLLLQTPIDYMSSEGSNLLWEIHTQGDSDSGFHHGADISMLSQFAAEKECMFPPCTSEGTRRLKPV